MQWVKDKIDENFDDEESIEAYAMFCDIITDSYFRA